ncbi:hypothetical protein [Paraburkholderia domus]|uniref:hypothetical protein n=1 Tax=Paraburkholderia domus TaxID=2793075 RepID=UPI001B176414|nr:hypothetical protein [Paraburkholderia domus]CAE6851182.1 hypothetical protein R75483_07604 [Paraburkholderia domus]
MASVNKVIFVGRLASAATTFRLASQGKVYSQPIVAEKFKEPINATTVIKVELVCVMKKVAMLRSLSDGFCGSGGLSKSDFAADTNAGKLKPCCCRQSVLP